MTDAPDYRISLDELEASARIPAEDTVESVEPPPASMPDPRGDQPDREWFAAGG